MRIGRSKRGRNDGEILRHVVGDTERGQRTARHQHLLADVHHFNQLGRVRVEVDHVARLFCGLGTGVHRHRHVGLREGRSIVGPVAGHRHQTAFRLILTNQCQLGFRCGFGKEIIHARFGGNRRGGKTVIPGDHHRFDPHFTQLGKALFDAAFDDVLQGNDPEHARAFGHHQRRRPLTGHAFDQAVHFRREVAVVGLNVAADRVNRAFTDHAILDADAAHAGLRREGHERGVQALHVALAQVKALLGEDHNAAAFRGFIGKR